MKTWEMVKALGENQNAKFKNDLDGIVKISDKTKTVVWVDEYGDESPFIIYSNSPVVDNLHIEWELVREPVDFMTAVNSGKRFKPESWLCGTDDKFRNLYGNLGMFHGRGMGQMKILNGKWLVE